MRIAVCLLVASFAVGLTGCGGGGGDDKKDFIAAADRICRDAERKSDRIKAPESADDVQRFADESSELAKDQIDRLRGLDVPSEIEDRFDEAMDLLEDQVRLLGRLPEAARQPDQSAIQEVIAEAEKKNKRADKLARDIGLKDCGKDG